MKKKLLLIALLGTIMSFIIYFYTKNDEITLVTIGDGLSSGMTPYNIEGYSFNDYLKEEYKINHKLKNYYEFASPNLTIKELIYEIKENKPKNFKNQKIEIQRAINEADILTIAIGMDELVNTKVTSTLKKELESDYKELLSMINMLNNNKVIVLGLYTYNNLDQLTTMKLNAIIRDITISNDFTYIDINDVIKKDYFLTTKSHYLNYEAHKAIYYKIKTNLK